ncbi:MAG: hypothetical protein WBA22_12475 [Candidatus Methanofastidiosia archaeon]
MSNMTLGIEREKSHTLKKARLKISEWLDFKNRSSNVIVTIYLEFFERRELPELDHFYVIFPESDFKKIIPPATCELMEENRILNNTELSKKIDMKSRFIPPIAVKGMSIEKRSKDYVLLRIDLEKFEINEERMNRLQFRFYIRDSFRKKSKKSFFSNTIWDWYYEERMYPLTIEKNEFSNIVQTKMELELWVMIEPAMYDSVSDLNIRSTKPFDRFIILPNDIAAGLGRDFVRPETLCIRWFYPEFSESGSGAEIILSRKKSRMEREKEYISKINSNEKDFFPNVYQILDESRIVCIDFNYIIDRLKKPQFSRILEILFELTYHRDDKALLKLDEFVAILEGLEGLKYGKYYFHVYRLLNNMRACEEVKDIIKPNIRKALEEIMMEPEYSSKVIIELSKELRDLLGVIERFYYYNTPEEKYSQRNKILKKTKELRDIAEEKLLNPESYLLAEEVLIRWERLIEEEFIQFVGSPKLDVKLKTQKLFYSEHIRLVFDITNIGSVPLIHLEARLLPSEQYTIEQERNGTTKRKRLTKSDEINERIFSPEFGISPKTSHLDLQLEVDALTEDGKRFTEIYLVEVELSHESVEFREIEENPYIVGAPVRERSMFFGREDSLKRIRGTIDGLQVNQSIIYGQFRIGKTSILYRLLEELEGKYVPVLAITHGFDTGDSELLESWSMHIAYAIENRNGRKPEIPDYGKLSDPYREFKKFTSLVLEKLGKAKIVLMIDEYELIDDLIESKKIDEELFDLLDWMIKHDQIEIILAGRLPPESLKNEKWRRIFPTFAKIKLGSLDEESARRLITVPAEGYIEYDDSAIERVFQLTNRYPYLVQLSCHVLVIYHNLEKKCLLRYADVEHCIQEIAELGSNGLEAMILTDVSLEEIIILEIMADVLKEHSSISEEELVVRIRELNKDINDRDIKNAISRLDNKEVIRSMAEETKRFKFTCELFRYWIIANKDLLEKHIYDIS